MKKTYELYKNKKIYVYVFFSTIIMCAIIWLICIFLWGESSKGFELFYKDCSEIWQDALVPIAATAEIAPYSNQYMVYPALSILLFYPFTRICGNLKGDIVSKFHYLYDTPKFLIIFFIISILIYLIFYEIIISKVDGDDLVKKLVAIAVIFSKPVLSTMERGNIVIISCLFFSFFLFYYNDGNKIISEAALISLSVAAALKFYPALAGVLLLCGEGRNIKKAGRTIIYGILMTIVPYLFLNGSVVDNIKHTYRNATEFAKLYPMIEIKQGVGLYSFYLGCGFMPNLTILVLARCITIVIIVICILGVYFNKKQWERYMSVVLAMVLIPEFSGGYSLLYFIPCFIIFLNEQKHEICDYIMLISAIIIMIPLNIDYHIGVILISILICVRNVISIIKCKKI